MDDERMYGATMCAETVDELVVVVHTDDLPDKDGWSRYCDLIGPLRKARIPTSARSTHIAWISR